MHPASWRLPLTCIGEPVGASAQKSITTIRQVEVGNSLERCRAYPPPALAAKPTRRRHHRHRVVLRSRFLADMIDVIAKPCGAIIRVEFKPQLDFSPWLPNTGSGPPQGIPRKAQGLIV